MSDSERTANLLVESALSPENRDLLLKDPENTLKRLAAQTIGQHPRAMEGDKWVYRIVISTLSLISLSVVAHVIYLSCIHPDGVLKVPDLLTALGSACIGALAGILAPFPRG